MEAGPSNLGRLRTRRKPQSTLNPAKRRRRSLHHGLFLRDEGSGGADGRVIPMDMIGTGPLDVAYTIPLQVGSSQQNLSLQVDTGSSDLWIASNSCSSCGDTKGRVYNPSLSTTARETNESFNINYLSGAVSGPIYWDTVQIGGYSIEYQALAVASLVENEPLQEDFNGILGLSLPLNSVIAQRITPVTNNNPDGATFTSNLFGITPTSQAPEAHFLSLVLARPGSDRLPSYLGIGRHPASVVPDPSQVEYTTVISDSEGTLYWKTDVTAITVYVDGVAKSVALGRGVKGTPLPIAVLDTGVPTILTTSYLANGIYGAIGIGPSEDGNYYVPCTTPLNMTITLNDLSEIPLHPLDMTYEDPTNPSSQNCIGMIGVNDPAFSDPSSDIGDIILGVPFMRNVYTVMAYEIPNADGQFTNGTSSDAGASQVIHPKLGLLGLTDPQTAMGEFQTVRVYNQPLSTAGSQNAPISTGGKKMSVGIDVLIGLVGIFGVCVVLFFARWFLTRKKWNAVAKDEDAAAEADVKAGLGAHHSSQSTLHSTRTKESIRETYMMDSVRIVSENPAEDRADEVGWKKITKKQESHDMNDPWDPRNYSMAFRDSLYEPEEVQLHRSPEPTQEAFSRPDHQRTTSELANKIGAQSVLVPLVAHTRADSRLDDLSEFGLGGLQPGRRPSSMAGVGTARRSSVIDNGLRHSTLGGQARRASFVPHSPRTETFSARRESVLPAGVRRESIPKGPRPMSSRSKTSSLSSGNDDGPHW